MDEYESKLPQSVASWIVSLAISVACCAVLFVIFAGYLVDIKRNIAIENDRLEQVSLHEEQLLMEIRGLHHSVAAAPAATAAPTAPAAAIVLPGTPDASTTVSPAPPSNPQQVQVPGTTAPTVPEVAPATPEPTQSPADAGATPNVPPVSVPVLTPKP